MSFISPQRRQASYQNVDTASRVEGASPHELVTILFDELLLCLSQAIKQAERGSLAQMLQTRSRAMSILHGLEDSLDFEKGGDLALALARVYREAGRRIYEASSADQVEKLASARAMLGEIAEAWKAIAPRG